MIRPIALGCLIAFSLAACGDTNDPLAADSSSSAGETDATPSTGEPSPTVGETTDMPDPTTGDGTTGSETTDEPTTGEPDTSSTSTGADDTTTSTGDTSTGDTSTGDTSTGDTSTGDTSTGDTSTGDTTGDGLAPELPSASKPCPQLIDGTVEFQPADVNSPRAVKIWMDPDLVDELDGPVVFYWHGTGGKPDQAQEGLGEMAIQEILDLGGIVVAPTADPMAGIFPWFLVSSDRQDDLLVADEVLACAHAQFGVDASRVHSLGFSAGALHTAHMSIRRSSWIASVVLYSGGLLGGAMPAFEEPLNKFAAMLFHGGPGDFVVVGFKQASEDYFEYISDNGNFALMCDHGSGHKIPGEQDSVMQFLLDHPFGVDPEPYQDALPAGFPAYCALP